MKNLLLSAAVIALSLGVTEAKANNYYVSGSIGGTVINDSDYSEPGLNAVVEVDSAVNFAAAFGYYFTNNLRAEFEVSHRNNDLSKVKALGASYNLSGELETWGFLVNGYYDFLPENTLNPYLTAGMGLLHHNGKLNSISGISLGGVDGSDSTFGYQLGAGASFAASDSIKIDAGYRYLGSSDIKIKSTEAEYNAHEFRVGLRYSF